MDSQAFVLICAVAFIASGLGIFAWLCVQWHSAARRKDAAVNCES